MKRLGSLVPLVVLALLPAACSFGEAQEDELPEVSAVWPLSTTSAEVRAHILKAIRASDVHRLIEADSEARLAVAADPLYGFGYYIAAINALNAEDFRSNLRRALDNSSNATPAERLLIQIARQRFESDFQGALESGHQLIALDSANPRSWIELALVQNSGIGGNIQGMTNSDSARATALRALAIDPDFYLAHVYLANNYVFFDPVDFDKAEHYALRMAELEPNEAWSYDILGDVRRAAGQLAEAGAAYTKAIALAPDRAELYEQRGHVEMFSGNFPAARTDYGRSVELADIASKVIFSQYRAYVGLYEGSAQRSIDDLEATLAMADTMHYAGKDDDRIAVLSDIMRIALANGKVDVAQHAFDRILPLARQLVDQANMPELRKQADATIEAGRGLIAAARDDYPAATASAHKVMDMVADRRDPRRDEPAHEILGEIALRQKKYAQAASEFAQTNAYDLYDMLRHAEALDGAGRTDEARQLYEKIAAYRFSRVDVALAKPVAKQRLAEMGG